MIKLQTICSADIIQVFFAAQLSDEEILGIFERAAAFMRAGLEQYAQIPRNIEVYSEYTTSRRAFFFWMLTLDVGVHTLHSNLEFIDNLIQRIRIALAILAFLSFPTMMNFLHLTDSGISVDEPFKYITYGVGIPMMTMRHPEKARGRAPIV